MPAFMAEVGMPYWIDLTTSDVRKSARFYSEIMGWEVSSANADADAGVEAKAEYRMARISGLPIAGFIPQPESAPFPDTWITYFLSANIDGDCRRAIELGGRVLAEPTDVEMGSMALLADPAGAMFGLIEPTGDEKFVAGGEPGCPVWHELTATTNHTAAVDFYGELFDWEVMTTDTAAAEAATEMGLEEGEFEYATALADGAAFVGMWNAKGNFPPQVPSFWQTYLGVRDTEAAATKAAELGGEVIREPWDSPFGRMCILADSTGATITICEVEDAPDEEPRESDDVLNLDFPES